MMRNPYPLQLCQPPSYCLYIQHVGESETKLGPVKANMQTREQRITQQELKHLHSPRAGWGQGLTDILQYDNVRPRLRHITRMTTMEDLLSWHCVTHLNHL